MIELSEADKKLYELGFTKEIDNKRRIDFCSKHFISETNIISFDLKRKQLECFIESDSPFTPNEPYTLSSEELKTIALKCSELGWW